MPHGLRAVEAQELVPLVQDISMNRWEAMLRDWFRGNFYCTEVQADSFASAFQSVGIPFPGAFPIVDVKNVIREAHAVPGVTAAVLSGSTLRSTDPARRSSSGTAQVPLDRPRSKSSRGTDQPKPSTPQSAPPYRVDWSRNLKRTCLTSPSPSEHTCRFI